ncbi:hypothetical protein B8W95_12805, partial [Staphylococcus pasteuri]
CRQDPNLDPDENAKQEKMQAIVSKMRGQINEYKHGRATTKEVDWRLEKRRKVASPSSQSPGLSLAVAV